MAEDGSSGGWSIQGSSVRPQLPDRRSGSAPEPESSFSSSSSLPRVRAENPRAGPDLATPEKNNYWGSWIEVNESPAGPRASPRIGPRIEANVSGPDSSYVDKKGVLPISVPSRRRVPPEASSSRHVGDEDDTLVVPAEPSEMLEGNPHKSKSSKPSTSAKKNWVWNPESGRSGGKWQTSQREHEVAQELNDGRYVGEWDDQSKVPHGQGLKCWTTGELRGAVYDGQWKDGEMSGDGRMIHPDGEEYRGQWKNGKASGHGVYSRLDSSRYEGQWEENRAHGEGIEVWPTGEMYCGQHRRNMRHGTGTWAWADGTSYEGTWDSDRRVGTGVLRLRDGREVKYPDSSLPADDIKEPGHHGPPPLLPKSKAVSDADAPEDEDQCSMM